MKKPVTIIDYGSGNIWSVRSALNYLGCEFVVTSKPSEIEKSDVLILPGVGSFRNAMLALEHAQIDKAIIEAVIGRHRKILGICLGMQLLAINSTEDGKTRGLGLISSKVTRFHFASAANLKVPHIGFNQVYSDEQSHLFKGISQKSNFYFVHSYKLLGDGLPGYKGVCKYGENFLASYEYENVFATQFHPEKSQTNGLKLLKNFLNY